MDKIKLSPALTPQSAQSLSGNSLLVPKALRVQVRLLASQPFPALKRVLSLIQPTVQLAHDITLPPSVPQAHLNHPAVVLSESQCYRIAPSQTP